MTTATATYPQTDRTRVRRLPDRAAYDRTTVHAILDAGFVCHLGFVDAGRPAVIPTAYVRDGESLLLHGSRRSRAMEALVAGAEACVVVTHVDGLVLARSAFHHSINYRSIVVYGRAEAIEEETAKRAAFAAFLEGIHPGRNARVREPNPTELKATTIVRLPLVEVSAKTRTGPPLDDAEDMALPVWAGVVPLAVVRGEPVQDLA